MPRLSGPGWMVVGDAAMLVNSVRREGSNLAIQSGLWAGQVAASAHRQKNFSSAVLGAYDRLIRKQYPGQDLRHYSRLVHLAKHSPHFFTLYPNLMHELARDFFQVDGIPKRQKQIQLLRHALKRRGLLGLLGDMLALGGSLL